MFLDRSCAAVAMFGSVGKTLVVDNGCCTDRYEVYSLLRSRRSCSHQLGTLLNCFASMLMGTKVASVTRVECSRTRKEQA